MALLIMDPDTTLEEARAAARSILENSDLAIIHREGRSLAALFESLDEWLTSEGPLPKDWKDGE
jgi:hypothetical protein